MATLAAWACPRAEDADPAVDRLKRLQSETLITIQDPALVSWPAGTTAARGVRPHVSPMPAGDPWIPPATAGRVVLERLYTKLHDLIPPDVGTSPHA